MVDLNQLLRQHPLAPAKAGRERRVFERHDLPESPGTLHYRGESFPCKLLDISMGGCRVLTQSRFRDGAVANVELELSIFGLPLKICGVTQWSASSQQIGIRFIHPGVKTKNQVAGIISCLIDQTARDAVEEVVAADHAKVEELPVVVVHPVVQPATKQISATLEAVLAVLGDQPRVKPPGASDWPVIIRNLQAERVFPGSLSELNLAGCCVLFKHPFAGVLNQEVEVEFEIQRLHFRLSGVPKAIHEGLLVAIQFSGMSYRRRDELSQLIAELSPTSAPPRE
jgi:hypothetical protein